MKDEERFEQGDVGERAFVLRIWLAGGAADDGREQVRIVLQDMDSQGRRGFARLEEFFVYLEALCDEIS